MLWTGSSRNKGTGVSDDQQVIIELNVNAEILFI